MQSRRDFLKQAILLSGAAGFTGVFPESIQRAFAIDPAPGSSYLDAEHVVILMQENRSFDHALGTLQGVRGFNDPRAIRLANDNPVWLQTNARGETYAPFRLDIKDTRATWMSYLPHSRQSQVDAWNHGSYDQWLQAKPSRLKQYADMPLTLGHYTRDDIPFYYALADAFTVCDQNFSGAMTSTTPNRSVFWTGTVRENAAEPANMRNDDYFDTPRSWETFPEQLQKNGISWKFYQNELWADHGMTEEEVAWLSNFGCNMLECFSQYNVNREESYQQSLPATIAKLEADLAKLEAKAALPHASAYAQIDVKNKKRDLERCRQDAKLGRGALDKLSAAQQDLHRRAFVTNEGDPDYHSLTELSYMDGATKRSMNVPKGDLLHQFRQDVQNGKLPTVSWVTPPEKFSDHPTAPWFGAWYVSEVMDILTQNPEVWKKTIFILTYDENDGYFDHIPPYVAPDPRDKTTGSASAGLADEVEYCYVEDELKNGYPAEQARTGPVGMGFRVPMIVASPWSRGGWVNSQLFEHTSVNQFLEGFLNTKFKTKVREEKISAWRRAVSGDLTSIFRPFDGNKPMPLPFVQRDPFVESIDKAQFKEVPSDFHKFSAAEIDTLKQKPRGSVLLEKQEKGIRPSCALPYELSVETRLNADSVELHFTAGDTLFGEKAKGAPFNVYARGLKSGTAGHSGSYTVAAGTSLQESWALDQFNDGVYHFEVYGPNGFYREFKGDAKGLHPDIVCGSAKDAANPKKLEREITLHLPPQGKQPYTVQIVDHAYGASPLKRTVTGAETVTLNLQKSHGWYDFSVKIAASPNFEKRYAGRVETGRHSFSDPLMGGMV